MLCLGRKKSNRHALPAGAPAERLAALVLDAVQPKKVGDLEFFEAPRGVPLAERLSPAAPQERVVSGCVAEVERRDGDVLAGDEIDQRRQALADQSTHPVIHEPFQQFAARREFRDSRRLAAAAEHMKTEGMERADLGAFQVRRQPVADFRGSLPVEGEDQDLSGSHALVPHQVGDFPRDHGCLPCSCAGEDQSRVLVRGDRIRLFVCRSVAQVMGRCLNRLSLGGDEEVVRFSPCRVEARLGPQGPQAVERGRSAR